MSKPFQIRLNEVEEATLQQLSDIYHIPKSDILRSVLNTPSAPLETIYRQIWAINADLNVYESKFPTINFDHLRGEIMKLCQML